MGSDHLDCVVPQWVETLLVVYPTNGQFLNYQLNNKLNFSKENTFDIKNETALTKNKKSLVALIPPNNKGGVVNVGHLFPQMEGRQKFSRCFCCPHYPKAMRSGQRAPRKKPCGEAVQESYWLLSRGFIVDAPEGWNPGPTAALEQINVCE